MQPHSSPPLPINLRRSRSPGGCPTFAASGSALSTTASATPTCSSSGCPRSSPIASPSVRGPVVRKAAPKDRLSDDDFRESRAMRRGRAVLRRLRHLDLDQRRRRRRNRTPRHSDRHRVQHRLRRCRAQAGCRPRHGGTAAGADSASDAHGAAQRRRRARRCGRRRAGRTPHQRRREAAPRPKAPDRFDGANDNRRPGNAVCARLDRRPAGRLSDRRQGRRHGGGLGPRRRRI